MKCSVLRRVSENLSDKYIADIYTELRNELLISVLYTSDRILHETHAF
mgnify:CR=1 FL=1